MRPRFRIPFHAAWLLIGLSFGMACGTAIAQVSDADRRLQKYDPRKHAESDGGALNLNIPRVAQVERSARAADEPGAGCVMDLHGSASVRNPGARLAIGVDGERAKMRRLARLASAPILRREAAQYAAPDIDLLTLPFDAVCPLQDVPGETNACLGEAPRHIVSQGRPLLGYPVPGLIGTLPEMPEDGES